MLVLGDDAHPDVVLVDIAVLLAGDMGLDQIAGDRRIGRRQLARVLERRDRLVVLADFLVGEAEVRQQEADVEHLGRLAAVLGDDRRELVDHRLILTTRLERLGERVIAPRALAVGRNHPARGGFGCLEVAKTALRL